MIRNFYNYRKYLLKKFEVDKKQFIKIINEEIVGYNLLENENFQKQFICDFLLNKKDKYQITNITDSYINNNWENDGYLDMTYGVEITYRYNSMKEPVRFGLWFRGEYVGFSIDSDYQPGHWAGTMPDSIPPSGGDWFSRIDWNSIKVQMHMVDDNDSDINFIAFDRAPERVQNIFISRFLSDFIYKHTDMGVQTPEQSDRIEKTGYC